MPLFQLTCDTDSGIVIADTYEQLQKAAQASYGDMIQPGMSLVLTYLHQGTHVTLRSEAHFETFMKLIAPDDAATQGARTCAVQQRRPLHIATLPQEEEEEEGTHQGAKEVRPVQSLPEDGTYVSPVRLHHASPPSLVFSPGELRGTFRTLLRAMTPRHTLSPEKPKLGMSRPGTPKHLVPYEPDEMYLRVKARLEQLELADASKPEPCIPPCACSSDPTTSPEEAAELRTFRVEFRGLSSSGRVVSLPWPGEGMGLLDLREKLRHYATGYLELSYISGSLSIDIDNDEDFETMQEDFRKSSVVYLRAQLDDFVPKKSYDLIVTQKGERKKTLKIYEGDPFTLKSLKEKLINHDYHTSTSVAYMDYGIRFEMEDDEDAECLYDVLVRDGSAEVIVRDRPSTEDAVSKNRSDSPVAALTISDLMT